MSLNAALSTAAGAKGRRFKLPPPHGLILQLQARNIPPFCPAVPTREQEKRLLSTRTTVEDTTALFGGEGGADQVLGGSEPSITQQELARVQVSEGRQC